MSANGVHGWVNVEIEECSINSADTLKLVFLDGRVAASMASQLLPKIGDDKRGFWKVLVAFRKGLTFLLEVRFSLSALIFYDII